MRWGKEKSAMSAQDNAMLARAAYGAFNERDFDRAAALVAEDLELINVATGETFRGPEGFKQYMQGWASAFRRPVQRLPTSLPETTSRSSSSWARVPMIAH
jgi:ketosteroid isomerase-like protein